MALILLLSAAAPASAQQPLGRLFFTPEQRAALDARRKARIPDKPAALTAESPTTRVDGHVLRSGGRSTVWVNGEPAPEGVEQEGLRVGAGRGDPGLVSVTVGESQRKFDLRVGQKLDRGSGEVRDVIGDGRIKVSK
jgi:hypothetical protein